MIFRSWRFVILENTLKVEEIDKIMNFCEHILARQIDIYSEFSEIYTHIYKERVS